MAFFFPPPPVFVGGAQPYAPNVAVRSESGALPSVDNPPFGYGGPYALKAAIVALAQPDPWQYSNIQGSGGYQPYGPRWLNPSLTAVPDNDPPFTHPALRASTRAIIVALAQPDPWTFNFAGGRQPFDGARLAPGIPGQSVDNPPFRRPSRRPEVIAGIVQAAQPDPWVYSYAGAVAGRQPYGPRQLNPSITAVAVNNPPFNPRFIAQMANIVMLNQAPAWPYVFVGGQQPYGWRTRPVLIRGKFVTAMIVGG